MLALFLILLALLSCVVAFQKVLVLGGSGFVGNTIAQIAANSGAEVIAISRRGQVEGLSPNKNIAYVKGDAASESDMSAIFDQYGPFDAVVHAIGLLLDNESGLASYNKIASGSGSVPGQDSSYDRITRQTSFIAIDRIIKQQQSTGGAESETEAGSGTQQNVPIPFVFVSAAEAGWTFKAPVKFLERYLVAKRAVENKLLTSAPYIRPIILRPSLIYTYEKPAAFLSVVPFFIGNKIGLPFVDRPMQVDALAEAAVMGLQDSSVSGLKRYPEMDELSGKYRRTRTNKK